MRADHPSVYPYSADEAKRRKELDSWRESFRMNVSCKEAIEEAIRDNVDNLVEKYSEQLKEYFLEDAVDSATEYYSEHSSSGGYEPEPEDYYREELDDSFDMSMRTLL